MCSFFDGEELLSQQMVLRMQFALALPSDMKLNSVPLSPWVVLLKCIWAAGADLQQSAEALGWSNVCENTEEFSCLRELLNTPPSFALYA